MPKPLKKVLPNGLTVLLQESHAAPVVSFHVWARVGSAQESADIAGICHLIEHMIFKGTSRRAVGQISKEVEAAGGDVNAYTSFDETVFHIQLPSANARVGLDILADAVSDPAFDATELGREKEVVVEEISRAEDNPSQMVSEDLFTTAYTTHTYRRPIAGDRNTVRAVSRETLLNFYRKWYVGSNLIFIGVGDFDVQQILPEIEALFLKIPAGQPPLVPAPREPEQKAPRSIERAMPIEGSYLDLAFPIPEITHPDVPALDLLSHILGGGSSSRLEQTLKEKLQLVSSIGSSAYTPKDPGLLIIGSVLQGNSSKAIETTIEATGRVICELRQNPPSTVELTRAKNNLKGARVYEKQTTEGLARKLGFFEGTTGDWQFEESYYRRIHTVTPETILEVAKKYLRFERATASLCHPQKEVTSSEKLLQALKKMGPPTQTGTTKTASKKTEVSRLKNGIRLVLRENHELPLIAIRSASWGGPQFEGEKTNGIGHLTALVQTKGTQHRTTRDIVEQAENLCGHMDSYTSKNVLGMQGSFLSEYLTEGLDLFADLLLFPSFSEEEICKEKLQTYTAIRNEADSIPTLVLQKFMKTLYGKHPYGLPSLGTVATVKRLAREQLVQHYQRMIHPRNLVISMVGDFETHDIQERLKEKLERWSPKKKFVSPRPGRLQPPSKALQSEMRKDKFQAHLVLGFLGTTIKDRDRFGLDVLNSILSGMGGRLFMELRDKQGLCYTVMSAHQPGVEPGVFLIYMGMDPAKFELALSGIYQEVETVKERIAEEEVQRARQCLIGNYTLDLQKNSTVAGILAHNALFGLPLDLEDYPRSIAQVTNDHVVQVARKYLRLEHSVLSVIKP